VKAKKDKSKSKKATVRKDLKPIPLENDAETEQSSDTLQPVRPKIGESADNLKQRSDWFQKRSGKH
jgi:hypothetical protein